MVVSVSAIGGELLYESEPCDGSIFNKVCSAILNVLNTNVNKSIERKYFIYIYIFLQIVSFLKIGWL